MRRLLFVLRLVRPGWWLLLSAFLHVLVFAGILLTMGETPPEESEPIPVEILREPEPPEAEPPPPRLRFGRTTEPRVREQVEVREETLAVAPPPLDAVLSDRAAAGGSVLRTAGEGSLPVSGFAPGGSGGGVAGFGHGSGNGTAPEGSFQEYVGAMRQSGLDVVFVIDATGSMGWLLEEVKTRVHALSSWIRGLVPVTRFGVVTYRDHDDPEFVTRVEPLTLSVERVRRFLDGMEARGGGDTEEAVAAGLRAALEEAGWKPEAHRVIVVIGDAPPHPEELGETVALARSFRESGGTVTTVDVSFDANPAIAAAQLGKPVEALQTLSRRGPLPSFQRIAAAGGGDASTLEGDRRVVRQLAVLIFGERWEESVRPLLGTL